MITFISCAKTMAERSKIILEKTTVPVFMEQAERNAMAISHFSKDELKTLLKVNDKIAAENYLRYHNFMSEDNKLLPAMLAYTGIVFKHINPESFTLEDWKYASGHLLITSFLYGLLRPNDLIRNYRLEGDVRLDINDGKTMFDYWKPLITDYFISVIKENGGLLFNLASSEMKNLFDWKRVEESVRVVTPEFYVEKNGKPKTVVVYSKMCRGEMTGYIIRNRIENAEELENFEWEGFRYNVDLSSGNKPVFVL